VLDDNTNDDVTPSSPPPPPPPPSPPTEPPPPPPPPTNNKLHVLDSVFAGIVSVPGPINLSVVIVPLVVATKLVGTEYEYEKVFIVDTFLVTSADEPPLLTATTDIVYVVLGVKLGNDIGDVVFPVRVTVV
jgi:hypothetical protein